MRPLHYCSWVIVLGCLTCSTVCALFESSQARFQNLPNAADPWYPTRQVQVTFLATADLSDELKPVELLTVTLNAWNHHKRHLIPCPGQQNFITLASGADNDALPNQYELCAVIPYVEDSDNTYYLKISRPRFGPVLTNVLKDDVVESSTFPVLGVRDASKLGLITATPTDTTTGTAPAPGPVPDTNGNPNGNGNMDGNANWNYNGNNNGPQWSPTPLMTPSVVPVAVPVPDAGSTQGAAAAPAAPPMASIQLTPSV